ncbi:protein C1orf43 homolog [Uloborus diversus]|uniref:protein C1orf43 homolog n=1 Tax=Uloborus diversus TaxID=327109 RepID=UPI002408FF4D|nr:protein C1orf43 homolog [Uloborus diversus]
MASQFSGIAIILFIAFGSLTFILLFIFAKRQITRFALKSSRGPHVVVGIDAPKHLRLEIERKLDAIEKIRCNPWLLNKTMRQQSDNETLEPYLSPPHLYRMQVVDDLKEFGNLIGIFEQSKARFMHEDVLNYFVRLHKMELLPNVNAQNLYKCLSMYEDARHEPKDFAYSEYCQFQELLDAIKNDVLAGKGAKAHTVGKSKYVMQDDPASDDISQPLLSDTSSDHTTFKGGGLFTQETSV